MRFCNTPQTDCGGGRRGNSATVRVLRCSWNCGSARITAAASRGDAESAGSKTSACWNRYAGIAVGSLYGNGQFPKVPHLLLQRFDVLGKSDFPLVGSLSCLYYWEKPHQPARGGSATVRVLRCSWNRDPARITVAASRSDAESADSKNFRLLEQVRRNSSGQSIRERAVSESSASTSAAFRCFGKIRLSSRRLPFVPILLGKAASARTRRLHNRAGSAMFLEPRSGADSGGGVKGRRGVCGFKNFRLLEHARRDSRGQSVRERAVSESSASTSAAFRCFGKIRLSSRRLPFVPILLGKAASARTQRVRCVASACEISRRKRPTAHAGNMSSLSIGYTALFRRACVRL